MSISSAISNAITGLNATSRGTENVSSNIANALTPGYARREIELSPRISGQGGGVDVNGVRRMINTALLDDSRLSQARLGASDTIASFHAAMEGAFGTAASDASLNSSLTQFGAALTSATARPDSETRLTAVLDAATALADRINKIAGAVQSGRSMAEKAIQDDVLQLNRALAQVAEMNGQIVSMTAQGKDASSLLDARQAAIDAIAQIVPIKEVVRENGRVALFTTEGSVLLDGTTPASMAFDRAPGIAADMSLSGGQLSSLTFNGKPLTGTQLDMLSGGRLGANFEIRDKIAPQYQQQIDAFARELYDRLASPAVDPSLSPGAPGLFTDGQLALNPANEIGLSSRIAVNASVDPGSGGAVWRIRAGINAASAGNAGESALLGRMDAALSASRAPVSATLSQGKRNLLALASETMSNAASSRIRSASDALRDGAYHSSLKAALLAEGVDTDKEMESLLALERAYSANAKVFQTANDMLDTILRWT